MKRILARETPVERKERELRCVHGGPRSLCLKCEGLDEAVIRTWNKDRSKGRPIRHVGPKRYSSVIISGSDRTLVSRPQRSVPPSKISYWYECSDCGCTIEIEAGKNRPANCPACDVLLIQVAEPFQDHQFDSELRQGHNDEGVVVERRPRSDEERVLIDLFSDPNSRIQSGGVGYVRIPLDAPRETRAAAPEWIENRGNFLRTLRQSRAARGEQILRRFYFEDETDTQIAEAVGWTKDAVKKERSSLIREGSEFFQRPLAKHPPSPAISERGASQSRVGPIAKQPPRNAMDEGADLTSTPIKKAYPVSPTSFVAVCLTEPNVIRLLPIFDLGGELYAKKDGVYTPLSGLKGLLRKELAIPRNRIEPEQAAAD